MNSKLAPAVLLALVLILFSILAFYISHPGIHLFDESRAVLTGTVEPASSLLTAIFSRPGQKEGTSASLPPRTQLLVPDPAPVDGFEHPVVLSDNTLVVGSPGQAVGGSLYAGRVTVYRRSANGWVELARLVASDGVPGGLFGSALAISGDTIVVGAEGSPIEGHKRAGAAYVFVKPAGGWVNAVEAAKLTASDAAAQAYFGSAVSISEDTVVVGAGGAEVAGRKTGAAYVFVRPAGGWATATETARLTARDGTVDDLFGNQTAVVSGLIAIGAENAAPDGQARRGAVYLFARPMGGWRTGTETARLVAPDGKAGDEFGASLALHDDVLAVGARNHAGHGAVYLFTRLRAGWETASQGLKLAARLSAPDGQTGDHFGAFVSLSHDRAAVAAPRRPLDKHTADRGVVYIFTRSKKGWADSNAPETILTTGVSGGCDFARAVALEPGQLAVGSALHLDEILRQEAVDLFELAPLPAIQIVSTVTSAPAKEGRITGAQIQVSLNTRPDGVVRVSAVHVPGLQVDPQIVTFSPEDWSKPRNLEVEAPAGGGSFLLELSAASADPDYDGLQPDALLLRFARPAPTQIPPKVLLPLIFR